LVRPSLEDGQVENVGEPFPKRAVETTGSDPQPVPTGELAGHPANGVDCERHHADLGSVGAVVVPGEGEISGIQVKQGAQV
jgi:hypothetical protein